jgi:hypothetical protein
MRKQMSTGRNKINILPNPIKKACVNHDGESYTNPNRRSEIITSKAIEVI